MTTAPAAPPGPPSPWRVPPHAPGALRAGVDGLSGTLLVVTLGVVLAAAIEPAWRAYAEPDIPTARRGLAEAMRMHGVASEPEPTGHPRISGGALDPANDPALASPRGASLFELFAPDDDVDGPLDGHGPHADDEDTLDRAPETAVAKRPFALRSHASDDAAPIFSVAAGTRLEILRSAGDWQLLSVTSANHRVLGWVRERDLRSR